MRPVTGTGRWIWGVSGVVTATALAIPGTLLITSAGTSEGQAQAVPTRTVIVTQPVTSLDVRSYGAPVRVTAGPGPYVNVIEAITFNPDNGRPPVVTDSVSGGRLTLAAPACAVSGCSVGFTVTVPAHVSVRVATDGGAVTVSGTSAATLDSGGGPVQATRVDGPLTVSTEGGVLSLTGLTGPLHSDTGGGPLLAQGVAAATSTVSTEGGAAQIGFTTAPDAVSVDSGGGPAMLSVPGGPYALTADSGGGPQQVGIATDPAASRSIRVSSEGGLLVIQPGVGGGVGSAPPPAPPLSSQP
jgi:hypothetical protein